MPSPVDLSNLGIKPESPTLQVNSLLADLSGRPNSDCTKFTFSLTVLEGVTLFFTPSPAFLICRLVDEGFSD